MIRTIISHDTATCIAEVRFEHNDVTVTDTFDLGAVIPGSRKVFADLGMDFDEEAQLRALDHLTEVIEQHINEGAITNPPPASSEEPPVIIDEPQE